MVGQIIDGQAIAAAILQAVSDEVGHLQAKYGLVPGLASLQVGEDAASHRYRRSEARAAQETGIKYFAENLATSTPPDEVLGVLDELNANPQVHGIIVQLPLPPTLRKEAILEKINPEKDVDGLHSLNIGRLATKSGQPLFIPSTAQAVMHLLAQSEVPVERAWAVVVGRSNSVGLPVAHLLMRGNATVTICHSRTPGLGEVTRQADILVVAAGQPGLIRGEMVKSGAVVIDVGINQVPDPESKSGYRLVGDVAFDEVKEISKAITPVPGGVGPVTVAILMENTLVAAIRQGKKMGIPPAEYRSGRK